MMRAFSVFRKRKKVPSKVAATVKQPPKQATTKRREAVPVQKEESHLALFEQLPEGTNLVSKGEFPFALQEKNHAIAFKSDGLYLDGIKYILSAVDASPIGTEAPLGLVAVERKGPNLTIHVGSFGDESMLQWTEPVLKSLLILLLSGRTYQAITDRHQTVEIARQMY